MRDLVSIRCICAELFDLRTDPHETFNLAERPDRADDRHRLHKALVGMMKDLADPLAGKAASI
jgi:arylsulfatase A-like enzyme